MGVAQRNRLGLLMRTGTWWASFEANPQSARLVFKSSLILSDKSLRIISPLSRAVPAGC
ncbi:hypothetical protein [Lapidilactobacillus salsurivasis]